jgi:hypothetical protein
MHKKEKKSRSKTPPFLLELPLSADPGQARRLRAHFEAARCLYNALLGEAMGRLRRMRADPAQAGWREPFPGRTSLSAARLIAAPAAHLRLFGLCPAELCQRSQWHLDC